LLKIAAMPLLLVVTTAVARGQSALDGFDPNANGTIRAVVVQPDGKILIGGEFTTLSPNGGPAVTRNRIARLNPDGTLDAAFNPNANNLSVYSIAVQVDGKVLVGGDFTNIGGQMRNRIARLDATTGLADSFDPNANNSVSSIVVQADGKILVGGAFNGANSIGGQTRNHIARLDATTGLADSFDPKSNGPVFSIAVQPDGKVLAGGNFVNIGGQMRFEIARLDATTGLADSFNPNADATVFSVAVQEDGKILAGGNFTHVGGQTRNYIARLDATTGSADSFNPNATSSVLSIAVQPDGKILAGGFFEIIGGQTRNYIARLDPATGLADSFNANATVAVNVAAVQADGKILAGGIFTSIGGQTRNHIARLEVDGRLDQTLNLGPGTSFNNYLTAVQPDGKILIGGNFVSVSGVPRHNIARVNTDGTLDMAFDPNSSRELTSIAVQADGNILVAGYFNSIGGQARNYIARLDATTGQADSFNPNPNAFVNAIEVQTDGKILICGDFSAIDGQARNHIARLDATTGLADSFNPNANEFVYSATSQADGKVLAGGFFTSIGGQMRNHIARLDGTSGLADSFNPNANDFVDSIIVQPDGKILATGNFQGANSIGGQTRKYIARLDPVTGLADLFDPAPNVFVRTIAIQSNGKIVVGGGFNQIGGQFRPAIARLDATTGVADSYDPNATNGVATIALQADGKLLAGGGFFSIGGQTRNSFARLSNDTAALQDLSVTRTTIVWTRSGSSPQFMRVTFEYSTDNLTYLFLGDGIAGGSSWSLTGLNLPGGSFYVRARGYYRTGGRNTSQSLAESRRRAFLTPTAVSIAASPPTLIGGTISAATALSGGLAPTGTITFNVYGPDDPTCGGAVAFSSTATVNGNGNYSSASFTPTLAGSYRFVVIYSGDEPNASSSSACNDAGGSVVISKKSPTITNAASPSVTLGGSVSDSANLAAGFSPSGTIAFTLFGPDNGTCAGTPIFISTKLVSGDGSYSSDSFTPTSPGTYRFVATYSGDANNNAVATACGDAAGSVVVNPPPGTLGNISTRVRVLGGDNALIGGMIAAGTAPKKVIIRAIGPSLTGFGVPGALGDPTLDLFQGSTLLFSNDDWQNSTQHTEIANSGLAPSNSLESAIIWTLTPGQNYTAVVRGINNTTGVGVVEAFDLDQAAASKLGNISTRGFVDVDDNVMIAGLIVSPRNGASTKVLVRALGPTLSDFGVPNALVNPTLDLVNSSGTVIRSNDNWKDDSSQRALIEAAGLAPSHDEEAALVETVAPGAYTAIVRGNNRTTGVGLVEAYNIP
jgi:uncharacterized delta-60 repeat protein